MNIFYSKSALMRKVQDFKIKKKSIGFVPTMGALHDGHLSLLRRAKKKNDIVVLSIYVNPTQFSPTEDFSKYPRPKKNDILLAKKEKVDIIFMPTDNVMYPDNFLTFVNVEKLTDHLCGRSRKNHFRGVTTIVAKLLNIVQPDVLYLGQKDAQQAIILKKMIQDLDMPVNVSICPIVREKDGLAMSSRNKYLSEKHRREAVVLNQALKKAKTKINAGEKRASAIIQLITTMIKNKTSGQIDYIEVCDFENLERVKKINGKTLVALAVHFGKARLIDNIVINSKT